MAGLGQILAQGQQAGNTGGSAEGIIKQLLTLGGASTPSPKQKIVNRLAERTQVGRQRSVPDAGRVRSFLRRVATRGKE